MDKKEKLLVEIDLDYVIRQSYVPRTAIDKIIEDIEAIEPDKMYYYPHLAKTEIIGIIRKHTEREGKS